MFLSAPLSMFASLLRVGGGLAGGIYVYIYVYICNINIYVYRHIQLYALQFYMGSTSGL